MEEVCCLSNVYVDDVVERRPGLACRFGLRGTCGDSEMLNWRRLEMFWRKRRFVNRYATGVDMLLDLGPSYDRQPLVLESFSADRDALRMDLERIGGDFDAAIAIIEAEIQAAKQRSSR